MTLAPSCRLLVVGDLLLDRDVTGEVRRLAPDAPVPVVDQGDVEERPGGAGLAALLAARDGHDVTLVAAVGDDAAGRRVAALLGDAGVRLVPLPLDGSTPCKTRICEGDRSLLRLDDGDGRAGSAGVSDALCALQSARYDAALVADYGRGVTALPAVRERLTGLARSLPLVWDPHPRGTDPVPGAALATPNAAEAVGRCPEITGDTLAATARRAAALAELWRARAVAITRGAEGAVVSYGAGAPLVLPAPAVRTGDPCGAGDRFASAAAAALGDGGLPSEAVGIAVRAASEFVAAGGARRLGRAPASGGGAAGGGRAADVVARVRANGGTVVATGGCFDLLHAGHVATLQAARRLGDCLVVCLNSDDSVRRLKGPGRPVVGARDRARVLEALADVDAVAIFEEDTPSRLLAELRPDVWVKGGDYAGEALPEAELVQGWGGTVVVVPYLADRSTTSLIARAGTPARR